MGFYSRFKHVKYICEDKTLILETKHSIIGGNGDVGSAILKM